MPPYFLQYVFVDFVCACKDTILFFSVCSSHIRRSHNVTVDPQHRMLFPTRFTSGQSIYFTYLRFSSILHLFSLFVFLSSPQELGRRPMCSSPGCNANATKSMGELSERVKVATFLRYVRVDVCGRKCLHFKISRRRLRRCKARTWYT